MFHLGKWHKAMVMKPRDGVSLMRIHYFRRTCSDSSGRIAKPVRLPLIRIVMKL